jgi:hypothetical protein
MIHCIVHRRRQFSLGSASVRTMQRDSRTVIGYHGTSKTKAETILRSGKFIPSANDYDWLGHGIYFWEHAPVRAWQWAKQKHWTEAAVVSATIELNLCLDLTDIRYTSALKKAYQSLQEAYILTGKVLPANRNKARCLDCLVINYLTSFVLPECDTVRAPFLEGEPIFEGSMLLTQSHIQVVVRNPRCILSDIRVIPQEVIDET